MPTITSANLANALVKLVAAESLPALTGNLIMGNLVNRDFEPVLAQAGQTVSVIVPPEMEAYNLLEAESVRPQNKNLTTADITLNQHLESTFQIPDVVKAMTHPELLKAYLQPAVISIAEKMESDLLNLTYEFSANPKVGAVGTPMNEKTIEAAETALFNAKLPASAAKYLVVDPASYSSIRQEPRFSEYSSAGAAGLKALTEGSVGKIKDFYIFRSQFAASAQPTGQAKQYTSLAFGRDAIGLVVRRLPQPLPGTGAIAEYAEMGNFGIRVVMSYQPNTLAQQFTVDVLYGRGVLRNKFGVQVLS